jgi:hypothetical protein
MQIVRFEVREAGSPDERRRRRAQNSLPPVRLDQDGPEPERVRGGGRTDEEHIGVPRHVRPLWRRGTVRLGLRPNRKSAVSRFVRPARAQRSNER